TRLVVNELDQIVETISGGPGFRTRSFFDRNGLLERQERDNLNDIGQPLPEGDEVRTYKYDAQNNLIRETIGGTRIAEQHVIRHCYDSSDNRHETIRPAGNNVRFIYDERMLPQTFIRGASSVMASTERTRYDGDGRKIAFVDGRGNITHFRYDTL